MSRNKFSVALDILSIKQNDSSFNPEHDQFTSTDTKKLASQSSPAYIYPETLNIS